MPTKRKIEDWDPNKSDSADSTYGASTARHSRSKPSKSRRSRPVKKKQRREYDESEENTEEDEISDGSYESEEKIVAEETDYDSHTGRPKRKAKEMHKTYQEDDSEDDIEDSAAEQVARKRQKTVQPSKIIKLKLSTGSAQTRRNTRARSGSISAVRPTSSGTISGQRRSSRIARDNTEPIIALNDSGHHANIIRPRTRSPPSGGDVRSRTGGKGPKKGPTASTVLEEGDGSGQAKDELEDDAIHQIEVAASHDEDEEQEEDSQSHVSGSLAHHFTRDNEGRIEEGTVIPESADEEDEDPISQPRRSTRHTERTIVPQSEDEGSRPRARHTLRSAAKKPKARSSQRSGRQAESSDFEPPEDDEGGEENISESASSSRKGTDSNTSSRRNTRGAKGRSRSRRDEPSEEHDSENADELAEELEDLRGDRSRRSRRGAEILYDEKPKTRKRKPVDYRILRPDLALPIEDEGPAETATPSRRARGGGGGSWQRSLYSTYGPFGGAGGPTPVFGGPVGMAAAGGADSDSSDDEVQQRPRVSGVGGTVGITPTSAPQGQGHFPPAQTHDALPGPANLGKIKDKQALADADPLGVDMSVSFDNIGGLQGHIDRLKEMVALPLLYPEVFQRFHVTPPRGVLFHGPPGTGKTLLARALASSVSSQGRKVTFYMRKGADALSKWVGEAERQLRLLFEEARKTQPSIIFFDEIDGLAPVRSSKQDQIHASIVSTLLALMDGMDGRGQVIVIGATNRPDSIDPALRRPGRFDREFYFPLPNTEARRAILDIHTKGWEPPLTPGFKDEIALLTKGYGGADLRALCTEAALNAVQRRYPQIYRSNEKLLIDPETITVTAKDFMISVKQMVPSSERAASSGAAPLPPHLEPLLQQTLVEIKKLVGEILPQKKQLTALEEAEFEDAENDRGLKIERMQQEFERSRVFRPRLLIKGISGMGQQYLASALLNHLEGIFVQSFDLATLLSDSSRSAEAAIVQLFAEVKRNKPSVIYLPNVDIWYKTVGDAVFSTFVGLLQSLPPTDPIMLLGVLESPLDRVDGGMMRELFGFSKRNQFEVMRPSKPSRRDYFHGILDYLMTSPADFPEPTNRKKRQLELLASAPAEPSKQVATLSKKELKAQKKRDRQNLNLLKLRIQPIMDQIRVKYKKFRTGVIDESQLWYLYEEEDPSILTSDLPLEQRHIDYPRPFEKGTDDHGEPGLVETATRKFFYNMEIVTIEKRLSNGYYKRPKDFLSDIKKLTKDAKAIGDQDRLLKANELQANVEVDLGYIEMGEPGLVAELEQVYIREVQRDKERAAEETNRTHDQVLELMPAAPVAPEPSGPIVLGQSVANGTSDHPRTPSNPSQPSQRSLLSNGLSGGLYDLSDIRSHPTQSNGTSVPSRETEFPLSNSQEGQSLDNGTQGSSFGQSAQTRPFEAYTGGPASLQQRKSIYGSLSQRSAITPMAEGSNPQDYANYASTTSSDKRNTGSSGNPAGSSSHNATSSSNQLNTQRSNGDKATEGPDLSVLPEPAISNSQLPDTQQASQSSYSSSSPSSQDQIQTQSSSNPRPHTSISAILNAETTMAPLRSSSKDGPTLVVDLRIAESSVENIVEGTSGCSVEQLEQIHSVLMDKLWQTRADWNRVNVTKEVAFAFEECLADMRECQMFQDASGEFDGMY
ncbi:MAG: hypothetical protein Q9167_001962 [Letrouitia subvulpina]